LKTALVAGSSGLIGGRLLNLLLEDSRYEKVIAISRKPLTLTHPKLENVVFDFDKLKQHNRALKCDDIFCCLGTTIKKVKTKEAFRKVDFDYPLELARMGKELGVEKYLLVSALGANRNSSLFYNQVKGEVEEAIAKIGIPTLHIFRPSLLVGPRSEQRTGEEAAKWVYRIFGFIIPTKYMAIESIKVARAMISCAQEKGTGVIIHESKELQAY
jgi:uncharacterized protein YbjT (DUF2867 family)